jgi:hypothetical protein
MLYTYQPTTAPLLEIAEYVIIFGGLQCTVSDARYKMLLGTHSLQDVTSETLDRLEETQYEVVLKWFIEWEVVSIREYTTNIQTVSARIRKTGLVRHVLSYRECFRHCVVEVLPKRGTLGDVVARVVFLTYLCMARYRDTGEDWCVHAIDPVHAYPVFKALVRSVRQTNRKMGRMLRDVHDEFQRFKTMEMSR